MILGIITLITALTISAVAIYYSVAGLVAIFAAATVPIIIMGSALEIAKLVTTIWLHRYWNEAKWWLKTYLTISVVVLMFITSMGIFGFLSKAHIDQTASARESVARIEQIDSLIAREEALAAEAEARISAVESEGINRDAQIQEQIDREQFRIDSAYSRIQPAIDEQNQIIAREEQRLGAGVNLYRDSIATIDRNLASIESNISSGNIEAVQALVGVEADGALGPDTRRAIDAYRIAQAAERQRLSDLIARESQNITSPVIDAARTEIQRLRSLAEAEIADSNQLISRLRAQVGTVDITANNNVIEQQRQILIDTQTRIEQLTTEKFDLEREYRRLEAEVGPIKYLAEFIYGETADKDLLEEAVRWVIIIIIFVFDPLAVLLLIASQYTFSYNKTKSKENEVFRIVLTDQEKEKNDELSNRTADQESAHNGESNRNSNGADSTDTGDEYREDEIDARESRASDNGRNMEVRQQQLDELEAFAEWKDAKHQWKIDNPEKTIKEFKEAYVRGEIDSLPWEHYLKPSGYKQNEEQSTSGIWSKIRDRRSND